MSKKLLLVLLFSLGATSSFADVNIYTDRGSDLMDPVVEAFTAETGEAVNYITLSGSEAIDRLVAEGENTPADIVIVKDMLYLNQMVELGLLQPMSASTEHIPAQMQHPDVLWAAVSMRARTIVYNMDKVNPDEVQTYASLGDEKWNEKLCLRTSNSSYNTGLVAGFVADLGEDATEELLESWMNNSPQIEQSDRDVLEAVENEECLVGIVNSYYLGQEQFRDENNLNVGIVFADQNGIGAHINGTGAGILATSLKAEMNNKFMEILLSDVGQLSFSNAHYDFPVSQDISSLTPVSSWEGFVANQTNWSVVGQNVDAALDIISAVGYE